VNAVNMGLESLASLEDCLAVADWPGTEARSYFEDVSYMNICFMPL
jgi:hypothetical protein